MRCSAHTDWEKEGGSFLLNLSEKIELSVLCIMSDIVYRISSVCRFLEAYCCDEFLKIRFFRPFQKFLNAFEVYVNPDCTGIFDWRM